MFLTQTERTVPFNTNSVNAESSLVLANLWLHSCFAKQEISSAGAYDFDNNFYQTSDKSYRFVDNVSIKDKGYGS